MAGEKQMQGSTTPQLLQSLIVGDLTDTNGERGIIAETQSDGLQKIRISDLHPLIMAMQYTKRRCQA